MSERMPNSYIQENTLKLDGVDTHSKLHHKADNPGTGSRIRKYLRASSSMMNPIDNVTLANSQGSPTKRRLANTKGSAHRAKFCRQQ